MIKSGTKGFFIVHTRRRFVDMVGDGRSTWVPSVIGINLADGSSVLPAGDLVRVARVESVAQVTPDQAESIIQNAAWKVEVVVHVEWGCALSHGFTCRPMTKK
jgi:hypothetical protein